MATTAVPLVNNPAGMAQLGNINSPKFARAAVLFLEFCRKKALLELIGGKKTRAGRKYRRVFKYFLNYLRLRGRQGYLFDPSANDQINGLGDPYAFGFNTPGPAFGNVGPMGPAGVPPPGFGPGVGPYRADDSSTGDGHTDSADCDDGRGRRGYPGPGPGGYGAFPGPGPYGYGPFPGFGGFPSPAGAGIIDDGDGFLAAFSNPLMSDALYGMFDEESGSDKDEDGDVEEESRSRGKDSEDDYRGTKDIMKRRAVLAALLSFGGTGVNRF
jgi:hypothetical protein